MKKEKKSKPIPKFYYAIIAIAFIALVYQYVFPESLDNRMSDYVDNCSKVTVEAYFDGKITSYSTEDVLQMEDLIQWAADRKIRIASLGDDVFSSNSSNDGYNFYFYGDDGITTYLYLNTAGRIEDSAKRYKIVKFSQTDMDELEAVISDWDQTKSSSSDSESDESEEE